MISVDLASRLADPEDGNLPTRVGIGEEAADSEATERNYHLGKR